MAVERGVIQKGLDRFHEQAKDLHVKNYIVYGKTADSKLYKEAAYTNQVDQADVEDAFKKGILIVKVGDKFYAPLVLNANKVSTIDLVSTTPTITEWQAKATV